jgi:hypothetical protein
MVWRKSMNKTVLILLLIALGMILIGVAGCGGSPSTGSSQTTGSGQTTSTSNGSGLLRNENWLIGTWEATVPKTETSYFAGKKITLSVSSVMLVSDEKVQGNPTGKFAYSGSLRWDTGGQSMMLSFTKENWKTDEEILLWGYSSPGANQFLENISMRINNDPTFSFELDWGPQISKPGSTFKSLPFYGSIQNLDTSNKDFFDPNHMITFAKTGNTAPNITSTKPTTTPAGGSSTSTSASSPPTTNTSSPTTTTPVGSGTGDIWNDIPIYPNAQKAEDQGFAISVPGDPSYSQIEWHFFATTEDYAKVVDFYKKQMPANGWAKMMWLDSDEMSWGSFAKNNETRLSLVYVIKTEGGAGINIQSAAR